MRRGYVKIVTPLLLPDTSSWLSSKRNVRESVFQVRRMLLPVLTTVLLPGCGTFPLDGKKRYAAARTTPVVTEGKVVFPKTSARPAIRRQEPEYLSFDEIRYLSKKPEGTPAIRAKLQSLWTTPVVSNEAWYAGVRPDVKSTPTLGPMLRVASWNIEKSLNIRQVTKALTSDPAYEAMMNAKKAPPGSHRRAEMLRQRERLLTADIIFLQEMDIGVSRSDYVDAARELATALKMNYAYGAQSLEVDPVMLGLEAAPGADTRKFTVDRSRYKGVFGSAILSKYPITDVQVFQLKTKPYDWYTGEAEKYDFVERTRRLGSKLLFYNTIMRELKVGARNFFRVDIAVPQSPTGTVTLVNNHLEIKTKPEKRKEQMEEILSYLKPVKNPIIMMGDHNSAPDDLSATSALRVIWEQFDNPTDIATTISTVGALTGGIVIPVWRERGIINAMKNFQNPLAPDIKIVLPNETRHLFKTVQDFRFDDGTAFDFRGDRAKTINGRSAILANSNEKAARGHSTTFSVVRPIMAFGRYRLDWMFVRSGHLTKPRDPKASYQFAPHYGETLAEFNDYVQPKFSDHRPIIADLPFGEPVKP